jgi:hypothetical protein
MSAAAMNLNDRRQRSETDRFVADMATRRFRAWWKQVETFKTNIGARAELEHVHLSVWAGHFACNDDAFSSVVEELVKVQ